MKWVAGVIAAIAVAVVVLAFTFEVEKTCRTTTTPPSQGDSWFEEAEPGHSTTTCSWSVGRR